MSFSKAKMSLTKFSQDINKLKKASQDLSIPLQKHNLSDVKQTQQVSSSVYSPKLFESKISCNLSQTSNSLCAFQQFLGSLQVKYNKVLQQNIELKKQLNRMRRNNSFMKQYHSPLSSKQLQCELFSQRLQQIMQNILSQ